MPVLQTADLKLTAPAAPRRILISHERLWRSLAVGRPNRGDVTGATQGLDSATGASARRSVPASGRETHAAQPVDPDGGRRRRVDPVDDLPRLHPARELCCPQLAGDVDRLRLRAHRVHDRYRGAGLAAPRAGDTPGIHNGSSADL